MNDSTSIKIIIRQDELRYRAGFDTSIKNIMSCFADEWTDEMRDRYAQRHGEEIMEKLMVLEAALPHNTNNIGWGKINGVGHWCAHLPYWVEFTIFEEFKHRET